MSLEHDAQTTKRSIRRHLFVGVIIAILLLGGLGSWSALASLHSAVIAPGTVVVEFNKKSVQHPDGGIVKEIHVRDGDRVEESTVLLRLDGAQLTAELGVVTERLHELAVRRWRLAAERDALDELPAFVSHDAMAELNSSSPMLLVQQRLFVTRRDLLEGRKKQLREQIAQLGQEINGLGRVKKARKEQLSILKEEIANLEILRKKNLVRMDRFLALKRDRANLVGEVGQIDADIARARGRVAETELQLLSLDDSFQSESLKELETVEGELAQLKERRRGIVDRLLRLDVRAPRSGHVHELAIHTVGGVVRAGETLLYVVPENDRLVLDARIPPQERDRIRKGMEARIRFTAFNFGTTPELNGKVIWISPDQSLMPETNEPYFKVRLQLDAGEQQRLEEKIEPGMPVEIMMTSEARSVISYLVKPMTDQINRVFRER